MKRLLRFLWNILNNERGGGGGGSTVQIAKIPEMSEEEKKYLQQQLQLSRTQLEQAQKQIDLYGKLAPQYAGIQAQQATLAQKQSEYFNQLSPQIEQQLGLQMQIAQQRLTNQGLAQQELQQALTPDQAALTNQQLESELLNRQMAYARGEMPELTPEQQQYIDEIASLSQEQTTADIQRQYEMGLLQNKNAALSRGLGSSSIREYGEGLLGAQALEQGGLAAQGIEQARFASSWDLPASQQIFDVQQSQFLSSLNEQAESNRQRLYSTLMNTAGIFGGMQDLSSLLNMPSAGLSSMASPLGGLDLSALNTPVLGTYYDAGAPPPPVQAPADTKERLAYELDPILMQNTTSGRNYLSSAPSLGEDYLTEFSNQYVQTYNPQGKLVYRKKTPQELYNTNGGGSL